MKLPAGHLTVDHVRKAARWRKMENAVKSFLGNSLHLLSESSAKATQHSSADWRHTLSSSSERIMQQAICGAKPVIPTCAGCLLRDRPSPVFSAKPLHC